MNAAQTDVPELVRLKDIPPEQWAIYNALLNYVFNDIGEDPTKQIKPC